MPRTPWYASGLRFECTQCGQCCLNHDDYSLVYLREDEARALARCLELDLATFKRRYTRVDDGDLVLEDNGNRCILLGEDNRCTAYEARPIQCRTWPFWPENLKRSAWENDVKKHCPGAGKGRLYTRAEIEAMARATDEGECDRDEG